MVLQPAINQQSLADFRALNMCGLAGWALACNPSCTQPVPRSHSRECTSLRTPSPYGQLKCFSLELPSFFGRNALIWRVFAEISMCCTSALQGVATLSSVSSNEEIGEQRCRLNYTSPRLGSVQPLPVVEVQEQTKPCMAGQRVQVWLSLRTLTRSKVWSSVRQETSFIAKSIQKNATNPCDVSRQRLSILSLRDVNPRQVVLPITQWARTALLRGSYYETSDLHFCSVSSFAGRCMYKARGSIQSRRDFAIGSSDRRVTQNCLRAYSKNLNALTVPLLWGGFLRFPIPFQSRHLQKDITCSTKS